MYTGNESRYNTVSNDRRLVQESNETIYNIILYWTFLSGLTIYYLDQ